MLLFRLAFFSSFDLGEGEGELETVLKSRSDASMEVRNWSAVGLDLSRRERFVKRKGE